MGLCGHTYAGRLWCILELFTLLAFSDVNAAVNCLHLISLTDGQCDELATFELSTAHCYDPNEEAKLRAVIGSVGNNVFEDRVHVLVRAAINRLKAPTLAREAGHVLGRHS